MKKIKEQLLLTKNDFEIIMAYIKRGLGIHSYNKQDATELESEIKRAKIVERDELPGDVVRLNSFVTIKDEKEDKIMNLTLVTPEKADFREKKISIMSPIGTALIGFRKGTKVSWKVPAGNKTFTILEVA